MHVMDFSDPKNSNMEPLMASKPPEEQACLKELRGVLTKAVDDLPEDLRTVFTLRVIEEADTEETADCLGLSEANVKIRLHRARALLRDRIDKQTGVGVRKVYQFDGQRCDRIVKSVLERLVRRFGC
jgi:RNA polymerase sigma-70 factor (ECF subfamily)